MNIGYLGKPSGIMKVIEIVLVVTSFALGRDQGLFGFGDAVTEATNNLYFGIGMLMSAMVVTPLLLAVYLSGKMDLQKSIFEPVVNTLFGASFVVYGSLMIAFYSDYLPNYDIHDYGIASGCTCLIAGLAYCVDLFFAIKNFRE